MKEKNLVVCDREIRYADSLAENILKREELAVKVYVCSSMEKVLGLLQEKQIHIFVVDESYTYEERSRVAAEQVFVLTQAKVCDLGEEEHAIYKYQRADSIIREIFENYLEMCEGNIMRPIRKDRTKLIAVYSPIHRLGKTRFAIALGKEYAKRERVLYLNMEEYAGWEAEEEEGLDMGDLLYYVKQGNGNLGIRLASAVRNMEQLHYVPPIPFSLDLKEISFKEWEIFLEQIMQQSAYERVILDIGEGVQGLFRLLEMCDRVYMPILEDEVSKQKLKRYERTRRELQLDNLARNTYQFVLPDNIEEYVKARAKED